MPMFPLSSVLFPGMPMALRVFEDRYLLMMSRVLQQDIPEFGIVLIERGSEAGGGEDRFNVGTVAHITSMETDGHTLGLVVRGTRRIEVTHWLEDRPHPRADVVDLPELQWADALQPLRDEAELLVRRTLAQASEFTEGQWPAEVGLSADPIESSWQLAGVAPIGSLDQVRLLRAATVEELLRGIIDATTEAAEVITASWDDEFPDLDE
jgi:Lon protease-like protein